jgi:hypothetical protein
LDIHSLFVIFRGSRFAEFERMKTLLVRGEDPVPPKMRDIIRKGSTELKEVRADEERDATTLEADRVVVWRDGEIELRSSNRESPTKLRWPQDEDKLRMFFQTGA